jgi:hypothetical protein
MDLITRPQTETAVGVADEIHALAQKHEVRYTPRPIDEWAGHVTRLAGDDVKLDEIEQLLIALQRAGYLTRPVALALQARYLREANP